MGFFMRRRTCFVSGFCLVLLCLLQVHNADSSTEQPYKYISPRPPYLRHRGNDVQSNQFVPLGYGVANGPAGTKNMLGRQFDDYFNNFDDEIAFEVPVGLLKNCWLQAMLATRYGFGPSCNVDGTYSSKQCHKKRCWCTDHMGHKRISAGGLHDDGFYFGLPALMLQCSQ